MNFKTGLVLIFGGALLSSAGAFADCPTSKDSRDWKNAKGVYCEAMKTTPYKRPNPFPGFHFHSFKSLKGKPVCFIGDTGSKDANQKAVRDVIANPNTCAMVRHLGDIVYSAGIKGVEDPEAKAQFFGYYQPFQVPWALVMGNHDNYGNIDSWLDLAKKTKELEFPHYYYADNYDGVCIVAMDTTPFESGLESPRYKEQVAWLEALMPKMKKQCQFTIFTAHHPYMGVFTKRDSEPQMKEFYRKYILGVFDLVVTGHDHVLAYIDNFEGTEHFISGAGGKLEAKEVEVKSSLKYEEHEAPGYIELVMKTANRARIRIHTIHKIVFEKEIEGAGIRWPKAKSETP